MSKATDELGDVELDSETQLDQETRLADIAWFQALVFVGIGVVLLFVFTYFSKSSQK